jgi:hypothetical protein
MLQQKNGLQSLKEIKSDTILIYGDFTALFIPINWYPERLMKQWKWDDQEHKLYRLSTVGTGKCTLICELAGASCLHKFRRS